MSTSPSYYQLPTGGQVIDLTRWLTSNGGQAVQYIARSTRTDGVVKDNPVEDLRKAIVFIENEIDRLGNPIDGPAEEYSIKVADLVATDPDEVLRQLQRYKAFGPGDVVDADRDHLLPSPPKVDPEEGDQLYVVTGPLIYMGGDTGVRLEIGDVVKVVTGIDAQGDVRVEIVAGSQPGVQQWISAGSLTPKPEQLDPQRGELYAVTGIPFYTEDDEVQPCKAIHQGDVVRIIEGLDDDGDVYVSVVGESNVPAHISTTVLTRLWI